MTKHKAMDTMAKATDKASASLKGVNFSDTDAVLEQYNSQIDKASELASAKAEKSNQTVR